jgi:two-component sensor histidine kinase
MQVISSLLNLQASQTKDPAARTMLEESRQRIRSIALIHEKLYNSGNMASIDFGAYLKNVADELLRTFGRPDVSCELDLEGIPFEIDRAVPAGLIVNELLTNALQHAFPPGTSGTVWVRLRSLGDDRVELVVQDDGIGFTPGDDPSTATMGLVIVKTLVEQMQGTLSMDGTHGTKWTIRFGLDKEPAAQRHGAS